MGCRRFKAIKSYTEYRKVGVKKRFTKKSVTNFLYCENEYLFVRRAAHKTVDAGRLNGIGGKLEKGENYLECAIRETAEETGYSVNAQDCRLSAVVSLEEGYEDDWVMCFFFISVSSKTVPVGMKTDEGEFMWLDKQQVFQTQYELVDDLTYLWPQITQQNLLTFAAAQLNDQEKITRISVKQIPV